MWTEPKHIQKARYVRRNPVQRGLIATPELWRWGSFRDYFLGESGPAKINDCEVSEDEDSSTCRVERAQGVGDSESPLLEKLEKAAPQLF